MDDNRFPMMVYRAPGAELVHGVACETRIVNDLGEMDEAEATGWHPTATAAGEALAADKARADAAAADEARALAEAEADRLTAEIRAPLQVEIDALKAQLAESAKALDEERLAHAKTKAAAAAPAEQPTKTGKAKA